MVQVNDKDLYQLLISDFRYSVKRDNHLAPGTCVQHITNYLPVLSDQWRSHTANQLTEEIIFERHMGRLDRDEEWEFLLNFLIEYIDELPINADRYMTYMYKNENYSANIDYYSSEIADKIKNNNKKYI